jgi:hypothetical protein
MFTQPKHGWSTLQIEDFQFPVSYLQDTPADCIRSFVECLNNDGMPFCIMLDGEDKGHCYLIADGHHSFVVYESDQGDQIKEFELTKVKLAEEFIKDMQSQDWTDWLCYQDEKQFYDIQPVIDALKSRNERWESARKRYT